MKIVDDLFVREREYHVEYPEDAYSELRNLLENKISFDVITEDKYFNDVDRGVIRARIETLEVYDNHSQEELEIFVTIKNNTLKIELKAMLVGTYDDSGWRNNIAYYGFAALFHRYLGIKNHSAYEEAIEGKVDKIFRNIDRIF